MKKIFLSLIFILGALNIFAQTGDFEGTKALIEKSNLDIENPKKNTKSATWDIRGNLFLDAYLINTTGLYVGMPQTGEYPSFGADVLVGEPTEKIINDDGTEKWVYERLDLTFASDKTLESWKETKVIDENALDKAYEAFKKAEELDAKGKYREKATTMASIQILRDNYLSKGIDNYSADKLEDAIYCFDRSLELYDYPKAESDTVFSPGMINFFAGEFSSTLNKYEDAKKYYKKAIEFEYEPEKSYHYLILLAIEEGNPDEEIKIIEEAYEKYPKSLDILYDLINYYMNTNNTNGALTYINKAVEDDPTNASVYFAKGTLYDKLGSDTLLTDEVKKQEYLDITIKSYEKSIELDQTFFAAYYNLGVIYYMKAKAIRDAAINIPAKENARYEAEMVKSKESFRLAMPYMEKAHELDPTDKTVISTLVTIYLQLQMYTEQKEMKAKLEALK